MTVRGADASHERSGWEADGLAMVSQAASLPAMSRLERVAPDLDAAYLPDFLGRDEADTLLEELLGQLRWSQESVAMFGRRTPVPRLLTWIADPGRHYAYSGIEHAPEPWPARLLELRRRLEAFTHASFAGVLANRYCSGADCVGWHGDDEAELGPDPLIASISLGAERRFVFRRREGGRWRRVELLPAHGSLLLMWGRSQRDWQHALPRTRRPVGERVNLTFRRLAADAGPRSA